MSNGAVDNGLDRQAADLSLSGGRGDEGKFAGRTGRGGSYVPPHLRGRGGGGGGGDSEPPRQDGGGGGGYAGRGGGGGGRDGGRVWDEARGSYAKDERNGGDRGESLLTMTEEYFYHYTNEVAAKNIFIAGKIRPSLKASGDAAHGDGVYLTTLDPSLGKETVKNNNWGGLAASKEVECYFEILMPSNKVRGGKEKRDILVHCRPLKLSDYKWSLKNWKGEILATQHFMVSSQGEAARIHPNTLGRYTLAENIVMYGGIPVYKHDEGNIYLYRNKNGNWCVGPCAGYDSCYLVQRSDNLPVSPPKIIPWEYCQDDGEWKEDVTLRVLPCY